MNLLATLGFGFLLGMRHAADADHVVAVSAIVGSRKSRGAAWLLGAVWGLGHTATVLLFGGAIVLLRLDIPPRLGLGLEFCVGIVLIVLGVLSIMGVWNSGVVGHSHERGRGHEHAHGDPHDTKGHTHSHLHLPAETATTLTSALRGSLVKSALVGAVHGLAGSAAVALLVAAAIPEPRAALLYLAMFGLGTVCGMLLLSAAMEWSMARVASWWTPGERALGIATGLLSLGFGAWIVYETAFSGRGLLSDAPVWSPR